MKLPLSILAALWLTTGLWAGVATAPEGWHSWAWPASNQPPDITAGGVLEFTTNGFSTNFTGRVVTNLYTGYGLWSQATNTVYTNWFIVLTNWYSVSDGTTNLLGAPCRCTNSYNNAYQPTNATFGIPFTNWIGVTGPAGYNGSTGRPTNWCLNTTRRCVDALRPWMLLTNLNADGGVPYVTNIWTRDIIASDSNDELFRWSSLRGIDLTNIVSGVTNVTYWFNRPLPDSQYRYRYNGDPLWKKFPLWMPHIISGTTATNWFKTDPNLTSNTWSLLNGPSTSPTTNLHWQYEFKPETNAFLNIEDMERLDCFLALSERSQVMPPLFNLSANAYLPTGPFINWHMGLFYDPDTPLFGYTATPLTDALADSKAKTLFAAKDLVYSISHHFAIKQLAGMNGNFNTYLHTFDNAPQWVYDVIDTRFYSSANWHYRTVPSNSGIPQWGNPTYAPYVLANSGDIAQQAHRWLGTPGGYVTNIITPTTPYTAPGFMQPGCTADGSCTDYCTTLTGAITNVTFYGSPFSYTPKKRFTSGFPGNGHIVTSRWEGANIWTTNLTTVTTNQWILPCTTSISLPFSYGNWVGLSEPSGTCQPTVPTLSYSQDVFYVVQSISNAVIGALTNVAQVKLDIYLRGGTFTNSQPQSTNTVLVFTTNLTSAANYVLTPTNSPIILTNWDIAAGYHEIDYGWDVVKTLADALTWQVMDVTPYTTNQVQTGRWNLNDSVSEANLGLLLNLAQQFGNTNALKHSAYYTTPPTNGTQALYRQYVTDTTGPAITNNVAHQWPFAFSAAYNGPTVNLYLESNGYLLGGWNGICAFWSGTSPPATLNCWDAFNGTNRVLTYTFLAGPYPVQDGYTANAPYDFRPTRTNSCETINLKSIAASALTYMEACTNFDSAKDLYAHSALPPLTASLEYGVYYNNYNHPFPVLDFSYPTGATTNTVESWGTDCSVAPTNPPSYTSGYIDCGAEFRLWTVHLGTHIGDGSAPEQWVYFSSPSSPETTNGCLTSATYTNQPIYRTQPTWNPTASGVGLTYDITNNVGQWSYVSSTATAKHYNIVFANYANQTIPPNNSINPSGWAIDDAKILIKWDVGTNGFRYHP